MMKIVKIILVVLLIFSGFVNGQNFDLSKPAAVGGNLVATNLDKSSFGSGFAPEGTGAGPGVEFFIKYNLGPKAFLAAGTGIQTITDKMLSKDLFRTTLIPNFELRGGFRPVEGPFSPIIFAGLHAAGYQTTFTNPFTGADETGDRVYDGAFMLGAGAEVAVSPQVTLMATGDWRYVFTSAEEIKPKLWTAKLGFAYNLHPKTPSYREEIEYPLDENELASLDELFLEDVSPSSDMSSEDDDLASLLFTPEEEAGATFDDFSEFSEFNEYPDTEEGRFNESVDQIKDQMSNKSNMLASLEERVSRLEANSNANQGLTSGSGYSDGSYSKYSDSDFQQRYQSGLNQFYDRNYQSAISSFQELLKSNPGHRLASNCQYWIGESYNGLKKYQEALNAFNSVLQYKSSYKTDDALLMAGIVNMKIGNDAVAKEKFQTLVNQYPDSEYTNKAMRYLSRL